jgi:prepilin-type N-terminal cleavage/methylation domain-containing protein/prepilin-type processing-associated H-X9-DG protein
MYVRTVGRHGFTLIELLVVIAIIAILAAILFPVFARARENARKSNCQSNLKQIGLAIRSYSQDYDERYPCYRFINNIDGQTYSWRIAILPYVKNRGIFVCPSARNLNTFAQSTNDRSDFGVSPAASGAFLTSGYYCNSVHWASGAPNPPFMHRDQGGISDAQIVRPAETIAVLDGGQYPSANYDMYCGPVTGGANDVGAGNPPTTVSTSNPFLRHTDGANYLFMDGHVKWQKPNQVKCGPGSGGCHWSVEEVSH